MSLRLQTMPLSVPSSNASFRAVAARRGRTSRITERFTYTHQRSSSCGGIPHSQTDYALSELVMRNDAVSNRDGDGFEPRVRTELGEDVADVVANGVRGKKHLRGNGARGFGSRESSKNVEFTSGQPLHGFGFRSSQSEKQSLEFI